MAFGTLLKDAQTVPIPQLYVPGTGFVSLQGSPNVSTDGSSNQSAPVNVAYSGYLASVIASALRTANGNTSDFDASAFDQMLILITFTSNQGTSPTIQFFLDTKDSLGNYYPVYTSAVISTTANPLIVPLGAGLPNQIAFGLTARLRWVIGGSATPGWTFGGNVIGK